MIRGEANCNAKLTAVDVREIRKQRANGERIKQLAIEYRMTRRQISNIIHYRSWKHVL